MVLITVGLIFLGVANLIGSYVIASALIDAIQSTRRQ